MKFDLDKAILDIDGGQVTRPLNGDTVPMTVRFAIRSALVSAPQQPIRAEDSIRRYDLQATLAGVGEAELRADDIVLIQQCAAQIYGPLIVGQIAAALSEPVA